MTEREILEKSIVKHQAAINAAQKDLANLDKPKLRHGDYGYSGSLRYPRMYLKGKDGKTLLVHADYVWERFGEDDMPTTILGNIFDDLRKRKAK